MLDIKSDTIPRTRLSKFLIVLKVRQYAPYKSNYIGHKISPLGTTDKSHML